MNREIAREVRKELKEIRVENERKQLERAAIYAQQTIPSILSQIRYSKWASAH